MTRIDFPGSQKSPGRNEYYPLKLKLTFSAVTPPPLSGEGETTQISSRKLFFTTTETFTPGRHLRVSLDWPVRLENRIPLRLIVSGRILQSEGGQSVMTIEKHEFRVRGAEASSEARLDPAAALGA